MRTYNPILWEEGLKTALITASSMAEEPLVGVISSRETSDKPAEKYVMLDDAFAMELLRDELVVRGLGDAEYSVSNDTYAIGLKVHRDHMKDDKLGLIMRRVQEMMVVAMNFPNKILTAALVNATSLLGFDGVSWFNNTHPARGLGAAFDNLLAGAGVTVDNIRTDVAQMITAAARVQNTAGEPFPSSRKDWVFMVPPDLVFNFTEALSAPIISQTSNVKFNKYNFKVEMSPRLADANDWFGLDVSTPRKPLIYQEHSAVQPEMLGEGSDHWVKFEEALFKVRWRGGTGYNHPGLAFKMVNT